jgi:hypothetical protein
MTEVIYKFESKTTDYIMSNNDGFSFSDTTLKLSSLDTVEGFKITTNNYILKGK